MNDQERENDDQEQGREPTQEYVDQAYALQEQPNAGETREDQDQRQAETGRADKVYQPHHKRQSDTGRFGR